MRGNVKTLKQIAAIGVVLAAGVIAGMTAYADESPAYTENFESCAAGTAASDLGWYVKGSNTITQTAAVQYDGDNGYLHFEAAMNADQSYNLFGISKNIADAASLAAGENFTVEYDIKMEQGEIYSSLSNGGTGQNNFRDAYTFVKPTAASNTVSLYTDTVALGADYKNAIGETLSASNSSSVKYYTKDWNNYRFVVHSVEYTSGEEKKTADYADLYINGDFVASLPMRFGTNDLSYLCIGYNANGLKTEAKVAFNIDNIKVYKGEKDLKGAAAASDSVTDLISLRSFNDLEAKKVYANNTTIYNANTVKGADSRYPNAVQATGGTVTTENGCFGKASDDIVVKNSTSGTIVIPFDKDNTTVTELANGDSIEYAMQFALPQGAANGPTVELFSGAANKDYLFEVYKYGIKIGSETIYLSPAFEAEKWYNLKVRVTAGENGQYYASIYADGNALIENRLMTGYSQFNRIKLGAGGGYVDNFSLKKYTAGAYEEAKTTPNIMSVRDITEGMFNGSIFAGEQTAAQMLEKLELSGDENIFAYSVINADGTVISEEQYADTAAAGKYIKIKAKDANIYFLYLMGDSQLINISSVSGVEEAGFTKSNVNLTAVNLGYGRKSDDESILISSSDAEKNFWLTKNVNLANPVMTLKFSVFTGTETGVGIQTKIYCAENSAAEPTARDVNILTLKDGKIYSKYSVEKGEYELNRWIQVAIQFDGGSAATVYIDGTPVFVDTYGPRAISYMSSLDIRLDSKDKKVFIDDISLTKGINSVIPDVPAISEGDGMLVDLGNTISIPSGITNNILIGELSAEKGNICGYIKENGTFMNDSDNYTDGILVLENGGIYKYYTFKTRTEILSVEDTADGGKAVIADLLDEAKEPVIIISYVGEDKALSGVELVPVSNDTLVGKAYISNEKINENSEINAYLWDMSTMQAITPLKTCK